MNGTCQRTHSRASQRKKLPPQATGTMVLGLAWRAWVYLATLFAAAMPYFKTHFFAASRGDVPLRLLRALGASVVEGFIVGLLVWGIAVWIACATQAGSAGSPPKPRVATRARRTAIFRKLLGPKRLTALAPRGERVDRHGAFSSRGWKGEGVTRGTISEVSVARTCSVDPRLGTLPTRKSRGPTEQVRATLHPRRSFPTGIDAKRDSTGIAYRLRDGTEPPATSLPFRAIAGSGPRGGLFQLANRTFTSLPRSSVVHSA